MESKVARSIDIKNIAAPRFSATGSAPRIEIADHPVSPIAKSGANKAATFDFEKEREIANNETSSKTKKITGDIANDSLGDNPATRPSELMKP